MKKISNFKFQISNSKSVFAKKSFGQNFLVDDAYVSQIIAELNPQAGETIIEIGAGRGALTGKLIESGANVVAVELDRDLIPLLENELGKHENFSVIQADVLQIDFAAILRKSEIRNPKSKLVANLPYYISTAILQKLIEQRNCFSELILMLQREVVERVTAEAGNSERGFLSVLVQTYATAEKLFDVPPKAFRPVPKVWSSVVRFDFKENVALAADEKLFRQLVSAGFAQKRKTILNNLKNAPPDLTAKISEKGTASRVLEAVEISPARRAETLTTEEWARLAAFLEAV